MIFLLHRLTTAARSTIDTADLARAARRYLCQNPALAGWFEDGGLVRAEVKPTIVVVTDLIHAVFNRIDAGYGRRFANHFNDLFSSARKRGHTPKVGCAHLSWQAVFF